MDFSIFQESHPGEPKVKAEYESWKEKRGVLLSRGEIEKQKVLTSSIAEMAAKFGKRRLERKESGIEGVPE
jgi:hypothetical protein